mgnify:CR=1 FL=1
MAAGFFPDPDDDDKLEARNATFWEALIDQIRRDGFLQPPRCVLDVGCHRGGLLARIAELWRPAQLYGIEPIAAARTRARLRLAKLAPSVLLLGPEQWSKIPGGSVDLVVCHEVLFLLPNLNDFVVELARVMAPHGRAYVVAGCHSENPVWPAWKAEFDLAGRRTFTHEPMELMGAAGRSRLLASVRPLRESGWATHNPDDGAFHFPTVTALLDHQFRHKLLFRLARR